MGGFTGRAEKRAGKALPDRRRAQRSRGSQLHERWVLQLRMESPVATGQRWSRSAVARALLIHYRAHIAAERQPLAAVTPY